MDISRELKRIAKIIALEDDGYDYISNVTDYNKAIGKLDSEIQRITSSLDNIKSHNKELKDAIKEGNVNGAWGVKEEIANMKNNIEVIVHATRAIDQGLEYLAKHDSEIEENK